MDKSEKKKLRSIFKNLKAGGIGSLKAYGPDHIAKSSNPGIAYQIYLDVLFDRR